MRLKLCNSVLGIVTALDNCTSDITGDMAQQQNYCICRKNLIISPDLVIMSLPYNKKLSMFLFVIFNLVFILESVFFKKVLIYKLSNLISIQHVVDYK